MKRYYFGIFLISLATLMFEVSLIRLFSIAQWYHFAFMVLSIAMFGIAASGTFLAIKKLRNVQVVSCILFSISVILGFFILNEFFSFDPYSAVLNYLHVFRLVFYYLLLGLPFFFFGLIIAYYFSNYKERSGKIYFYNLFGSGLGTLLVIPLISFFNVHIIIIVSLIGLLAALCFSKRKLEFFISLILILLIGGLLFLPYEVNMSGYKELKQALNFPGSELLYTEYNSFSRVDVINSSFTRYAPGLSSEFRGNLPEQLGITIDGASMNAITNPKDLDFIDYLPNSIAFEFFKNPRVLVINSGAGLDVLTSLKNNASVTALENNPIVVDLLKNEYKYFSGDIYNKAEVYVGEGRNFIKNKEKFDIIIISLAGNVVGSAAGVYSLTENYLFTEEAFDEYYDSLNDNGVLIITRWLLYPPKESLKLFNLAKDFNKENIAMFRSWTTVSLLLSKSKLGEEKIDIIKDFTEKNKFDIIYLPGEFEPNKYGKFEEPYYFNSVKQLLENKDFEKNYLFNIEKSTDNKPFYFNFFKWRKFPELYKATGEKWQPFFDSGFLLLFIFIQALILSLVFILLPLKVFKKIKLRKLSLVYFFMIGLAFMFIEIVFIQKFIAYFGHVLYSSVTVIFSILMFSSIGSLVSQRLETSRLKFVIYILSFLIFIYVFLVPFFIDRFVFGSLILKIILVSLFIAPLAFFMGMPFPLGIRILAKEFIPWAWAINGSASILGSILVILIALSIGYNFTLILGLLFYLTGFIFIRKDLFL